MKKNILIIGFGDLAQRLEAQLLDKDVAIYGLTRSPKKYKGTKLIEWDWLNQEPFKAPEKKFDSVIFFPKPTDFSENGYKLGFIEPLKTINKSLEDIEFKSFIGISSTRVYGSHQEGELTELNTPEPSDYRGSIILEYEKLIQSLFQSNSLILRLSGLYDDNTNWLKDFVENFKLNLYSDEIFVFTPAGELKSLPQNSTALDFAFEIHTQIGTVSYTHLTLPTKA